METEPGPWIAALRSSHDTLTSLVEPLDDDQLEGPSYASEWTVAQVLSHIGSSAEIFTMFLDASLAGEPLPGREAFPPIWEAWNGRSPRAQASDALAADGQLVARFESFDAEQLEQLRFQLFGMDLDVAGVAALRLGEHAVHTWDVAVALEPGAELPDDAVSLLVDSLGRLAARSGKSGGSKRQVLVVTSAPERRFVLDLGDTVSLEPVGDGEDTEERPELSIPAEAFIRLVYGRLDPEHTPTVEARGVELDELRGIFPGF